MTFTPPNPPSPADAPSRSPTTQAPSLPPGVTASPTQSEGEHVANLAVAWTLFAVMLFFTATSRYIAKLIFALTSTLPMGWALKSRLESPLTWALVVLFTYFAIYFVPWAASLAWLESALYVVNRFFAWIVIFYACLAITNLVVDVLAEVLYIRRVEPSIRQGVVEAVRLLQILALFFILIVLLTTLPPDYSPETVRRALSLFTRINVVTGVLVFSLAPVLRDLVAGLTVYSDEPYRIGDVVSVPGCASKGVVEEIRLRVTTLRLPDDSVLFVPNTKVLKFPTVNESPRLREMDAEGEDAMDAPVGGVGGVGPATTTTTTRKRDRIKVRIPVSRLNTRADALRNGLVACGAHLAAYGFENVHAAVDENHVVSVSAVSSGGPENDQSTLRLVARDALRLHGVHYS